MPEYRSTGPAFDEPCIVKERYDFNVVTWHGRWDRESAPDSRSEVRFLRTTPNTTHYNKEHHMIDLEATFKKFEDEYLEFHRVTKKLNGRPDLCAFLLIDKLLPNPGSDIIPAAEHDEFWLDADMEKLAQVATEEDILTLVRCGIRYDSECDSLAMFA
jgi:hypothetical protein